MKTAPLPINESQYFFSDGNTIFYQNYTMKAPKPIPNADAESFELVYSSLACDKNYVYVTGDSREGLQIFEPADRDSLIFFSCYYFADKFNLYRYNHHFIEYESYNRKDIHAFEPGQFYDIHLRCELKKIASDAQAWWNEDLELYKKFKHITHDFYQYDDRLFYHFREDNLETLDPLYKYSDSTRGLDYPCYSYNILHEENHYLPLPNAEPSTFTALNEIYSKDAQQVYFFSRVIKADLDSFEVIDGLYAKDNNGIWFNGRLAKIEDIDSFEIIVNGFHSYAKDRKNVYSSHVRKLPLGPYSNTLEKLKNSDPDTFTILTKNIAKDKNNVYWKQMIFRKADGASFELLKERTKSSYGYAKDKNFVYYDNGELNIKKRLDGKSFKKLNDFWAIDDNYFYSFIAGKPYKSKHLDTFKVIEGTEQAKDKTFLYDLEWKCDELSYVGYVLKKTKLK